jgi:3-oxoacyl-[acyl-carrier-protein] synthase II
MTLSVRGIGWISLTGYGMTASGVRVSFVEGGSLATVPRGDLFLQSVKNFGRLDRASRTTLTAVSLALRDGGVVSSPGNKRAIGIVGTNSDGSLTTDLDYYRDYVENGRKLSRANLFIYTLPSSPLGEAAIHFGLTGPLLYTQDRDRSPLSSLTMAAGLLRDGSSLQMLAGMSDGDQGIYLLLDREEQGSLCSLDEAVTILTDGGAIDAIAARFALLVGR